MYIITSSYYEHAMVLDGYWLCKLDVPQLSTLFAQRLATPLLCRIHIVCVDTVDIVDILDTVDTVDAVKTKHCNR
jgi:hypothetical protein